MVNHFEEKTFIIDGSALFIFNGICRLWEQ